MLIIRYLIYKAQIGNIKYEKQIHKIPGEFFYNSSQSAVSCIFYIVGDKQG